MHKNAGNRKCQILGNKLKLGLMMSGELHSLDDSQGAGALEMEDLAIDTDKLHLNLNVCRGKCTKLSAYTIRFSARASCTFLCVLHPAIEPKGSDAIGYFDTAVNAVTFKCRFAAKFHRIREVHAVSTVLCEPFGWPQHNRCVDVHHTWPNGATG